MNAPLFSVATPTRNALNKLRRCVGSLRGQGDLASYEHLVQDACSSDGTPDWLSAQALSDVALLPHVERDAGMYDAINRAWARSRGKYLSWLNADEQYLPGTLSRVDAYFTAHPEVEVLFADYMVVDERGHAVALRREIPLRKFYVVNSFLNAQSCTLFFRRRLWDAGLLRLDSQYRYAADKELVLRLLAHGIRFHHLSEVWSLFGVDGENLSTHRGMEVEAERIRLAYGGFSLRPLRALPLLCRRAERLFRGAYWPVDVHYRFAIDEVPNSVEFCSRDVGGRYSLDEPRGHVDQILPLQKD